MGVVHECGQRYIHVQKVLHRVMLRGRVGGAGSRSTQTGVVGEKCTKERVTIIYTAQRIVEYLLL